MITTETGKRIPGIAKHWVRVLIGFAFGLDAIVYALPSEAQGTRSLTIVEHGYSCAVTYEIEPYSVTDEGTRHNAVTRCSYSYESFQYTSESEGVLIISPIGLFTVVTEVTEQGYTMLAGFPDTVGFVRYACNVLGCR